MWSKMRLFETKEMRLYPHTKKCSLRTTTKDRPKDRTQSVVNTRQLHINSKPIDCCLWQWLQQTPEKSITWRSHIHMQQNPLQKRFLVCSSPFMRLAQHPKALRAWCKKCLPARWKPDVLRPGIVGVRGSIMVIPLRRPCMIMSTPPSPLLHSTKLGKKTCVLYYCTAKEWFVALIFHKCVGLDIRIRSVIMYACYYLIVFVLTKGFFHSRVVGAWDQSFSKELVPKTGLRYEYWVNNWQGNNAYILEVTRLLPCVIDA